MLSGGSPVGARSGVGFFGLGSGQFCPNCPNALPYLQEAAEAAAQNCPAALQLSELLSEGRLFHTSIAVGFLYFIHEYMELQPIIDQLVFPGDVVLDVSKLTNQTIKLGGGLRQDGDVISAMKAGVLRFSKPNKYWVESSHKRYVPVAGDNVLGIVVDARSDNFLVDVKGPTLAFLPVLAFEGGTRRNIPKFEIGTLLYVRVVKAEIGMNPELSCMDATGKAAEYGPLKDGFMFETSTGLSRTLLSSPTCPVLETLGKKLAFEIAVGLNGRVWVNATTPSIIVLVVNTIKQTESMSPTQQKIRVESLLQKLQ